MVIPSTVTKLGSSSFSGCSLLSTITFAEGSSLTVVDYSVFFRCSSLKSVQFPSSVSSLGSSVFEECIKLETVNIPKSLKSMGEYGFYGCQHLHSFTVSEGNTYFKSG